MRTPGFFVPSPGMSMDEARDILKAQTEKYNFDVFDPSAIEDAEVLEHFGVKGMKWGVRQALSTSDDAKVAKSVKNQAKVGGVESLTNEQISKAIARMNLENQYKKSISDSSLKQKGMKFVGALLLTFGKAYLSSFIQHPTANAATGGNFAWAYAGAKTIDGVVTSRRELGN